MPLPGYQNLNQREEDAQRLSEILSQLSFDQKITIEGGNTVGLSDHLENLSQQLRENKITAESYFNNSAVKQAIDSIKPKSNYYFLAMLELFYKQSFSFSAYEKIFKFMSQVMLFVGAVLLYENYVLYFDARPKLERTGNGIEDYCNGLASTIADVCGLLTGEEQAFFSIDTKTNGKPFFIGNPNATLTAPTQKIPSLFNPVEWVNSISCNSSSDGSALQITGNNFFGSPAEFDKRAKGGVFPVIQSMVSNNNATILLAVSIFLAEFCITIQNGGYSNLINPATNTAYGHTPGFELPAKDFGIYSRVFGSLYGFFVGAAGLTMLILQARKAVEKYRGVYQILRACEIYEKYNPESASPRNQV